MDSLLNSLCDLTPANMMTSSNGNIFRVTGHLCGKFTGPRWISRTKASDAELWCSFDMRPNIRLSKHSWGWWFETPPQSLWRHRNEIHTKAMHDCLFFFARVWPMESLTKGQQCGKRLHVMKSSWKFKRSSLFLITYWWGVNCINNVGAMYRQ